MRQGSPDSRPRTQRAFRTLQFEPLEVRSLLSQGLQQPPTVPATDGVSAFVQSDRFDRHRPRSGVIGQVLIGPSCREPLSCIDDVAFLPYRTRIAVHSDTGQFLFRVNTDSEGMFKIRVRPGTYKLVPKDPPEGPSPAPGFASLTVEVQRRVFVHETIIYEFATIRRA